MSALSQKQTCRHGPKNIIESVIAAEIGSHRIGQKENMRFLLGKAGKEDVGALTSEL